MNDKTEGIYLQGGREGRNGNVVIVIVGNDSNDIDDS